MNAYPLLDLQSTWKDARLVLQAIHTLASALYDDAALAWADMETICAQTTAALAALGTLPHGVLNGIKIEEADLEEQEAWADRASY